MSQGLEDSGDFWRHSHCLLSQDHPLIDFVERLSIAGPLSMLPVYDDLDILQIDIACAALGIIGNPSPTATSMSSWDLLLLGVSLKSGRFLGKHRPGEGISEV